MGLAICRTANTPNFITGNAPITILLMRVLLVTDDWQRLCYSLLSLLIQGCMQATAMWCVIPGSPRISAMLLCSTMVWPMYVRWGFQFSVEALDDVQKKPSTAASAVSCCLLHKHLLRRLLHSLQSSEFVSCSTTTKAFFYEFMVISRQNLYKIPFFVLKLESNSNILGFSLFVKEIVLFLP